MRFLPILAALALASLSACATAPTPITTLTQAVRATNLAEQGADLAIRARKPSPETASLLNRLRGEVRAALDSLSASQLAGAPLDFSALNAALAALNGAAASASSAASSAAS